MKTILLGNGLNRLNYENSWDSLVHTINEDKETIGNKCYFKVSPIPNTIQFNARTIKELINKYNNIQDLGNIDKQLKEKIKNEMLIYKPHKLHQKLISLNPEHFMTTNYDDVIDKAICKNKKFVYIKNTDSYQKQKYSIRRCRQYWNKNEKMTTWNIHGELEYTNSMMLGYDHYCGSIKMVDDYLNGAYRYNRRLRTVVSMEDKLLNNKLEILSWIDLFFFTDVHILGLSMGYEELDLWHVLMKRKELQIALGKDKVTNRIFYYGEVTGNGKRELMELYDINIIRPDVEPIKNNYTPVYADLIDKMSQYFIQNNATPTP